MSIEEKILKYLHDIFPDIRIFTLGTIPLEDLDLNPQKDTLDYEKVFDNLKDEYYIEYDAMQISITFPGIFYYEEKYLKPDYYYLKAIRILLEFLEKLENGQYASIPNSDIIGELKKEEIDMNNKEFYQFLVTLNQRANFFKNIGPFGIREQDEIKPYIRNKALLTPDGRKFLYSWRYESNLFSTITDPLQKTILLEEYEELQKDIQQSSWKGASIKIGGILEYLLTNWLKDKGITPSQILNTKKVKNWKDVSFHLMTEYYMNNSRNFTDEIGTYTDWNLVKNILKDYRNYIHLTKYEERIKQGNFLRKKEFDRIYPIFQEILNKF